MAKKSSFNYGLAFKMLQPYVDLKIRKNKVNFSAADKTKIRNAEKALINEGLIYFDQELNKYVPARKFRKNSKKGEKIRGVKQKLKGEFIRGAKVSDKLRGNTIIGENFDKIFVPLDMSGIEEQEEETDLEDFAFHIVLSALSIEQYQGLTQTDYFTVVVANGWEIGRGNIRYGSYPKKKIQFTDHKGRKGFKRVIDKEATLELKDSLVNKFAEGLKGRKKKVEAISRRIAELIERIYTSNANKYKLGIQTISGLYLYKFKKQRKPKKREIKKMSGKKKK